MTGIRNAPTIVNAAYLPFQFWDGRAKSLEEQAANPIADPVEMNQTHEVSVSKLSADPTYKPLFNKAFGPGGITIGRVENALASFERTVLSGNSPFDRYQFGGDKNALTPEGARSCGRESLSTCMAMPKGPRRFFPLTCCRGSSRRRSGSIWSAASRSASRR